MLETLDAPSEVVSVAGSHIDPTAGRSERYGYANYDYANQGRVRIRGKGFLLNQQKWRLKGFAYGPFAPRTDGHHLPERGQIRRDFAHMRELGANAIRVYHVPPVVLLDDALEHGLRVLVDIPWEKHRCFFEDYAARQAARRAVRISAMRLGAHPGLLGLSVVNEIPADIARFYGPRRIEHFIEELLDVAHQHAPEALALFANFPTTEFLYARNSDLACFNVYLQDPQRLSDYLVRLGHLAGNQPLLLGEFGFDERREGGADRQAELLARHVPKIFAAGVAGAFTFSYTDDWFTGGRQIEDWFFGVTTRQRQPKPAAAALSQAWRNIGRLDRTRSPLRSLSANQARPQAGRLLEIPGRREVGNGSSDSELPRVSVVVCSYNAAATLEACLASLVRLNYPDYEVILVDDGSTDHTAHIAARYPQVRYLPQPNRGLSAARNAGLAAATGKIVAYTDADCMAEPDWLEQLVLRMRSQSVEAMGGPNIPPAGDGWVARVVAASPGGPSHVMLTDTTAEHIPGCNMAFNRQRLLALGGFDPRFRQAGDDVDICWRWLNAGWDIGFAPAAVVWHKRRRTVKAYLRQQAGYGRAEGMLMQKYPERFNRLGGSRWRGIIYGEAAVGLPVLAPRIYHGQYGSSLFQSIYRSNEYRLSALFSSLEWYALTLVLWAAGVFVAPLLLLAAVATALLAMAVWRAAMATPLPPQAPHWARPLMLALHAVQPLVRSMSRYRQIASAAGAARRSGGRRLELALKKINWRTGDLYFTSAAALGRRELLREMVELCRGEQIACDTCSQWADWDLQLPQGLWRYVRVRTATEELAWPNRFTRCRLKIYPTAQWWALVAGVAVLSLAAWIASCWPALAIGVGLMAVWGGWWRLQARRALRAAGALVFAAGRAVGLKSYTVPGAGRLRRGLRWVDRPTPSTPRRVADMAPAS